MTRRHGRDDGQPGDERQDTGRMGFRRDSEPVDERPLLAEYACRCKGCREHEGFWRNHTERLMYEDAAESMPSSPGEGPAAYIKRLSEAVTAKYAAGVQPMPRI